MFESKSGNKKSCICISIGFLKSFCCIWFLNWIESHLLSYHFKSEIGNLYICYGFFLLLFNIDLYCWFNKMLKLIKDKTLLCVHLLGVTSAHTYTQSPMLTNSNGFIFTYINSIKVRRMKEPHIQRMDTVKQRRMKKR